MATRARHQPSPQGPAVPYRDVSAVRHTIGVNWLATRLTVAEIFLKVLFWGVAILAAILIVLGAIVVFTLRVGAPQPTQSFPQTQQAP